MSDDFSRAIGRIEGLFEQIDKKLDKVEQALNAHKSEDIVAHSDIRGLVYKERDKLQSDIQAFQIAKAVVAGQLTLGQKTIAFIGAIAGFVAVLIEIAKAFHVNR